MKSNEEQLNINNLMSVAVSTALMSMGESAEIIGTYTARCLEPVPEFKSEYDSKFQMYLRAIENGYDAEVKTLQAEMDLIPKQEVWVEEFHNLVTTAGKNHMLDNYIAGSAFTQVGPFMGLISSVSYAAGPNIADTMASHGGWLEAGSTNAPTFAARIAPSWSAASAGSKAASTAVSFTMTGAGTLKGAFLVLGTGAVVTLMSTAGTLFSAGTFGGGDQVVSSGNVVQVSYSLGL